MFSFLMMIDFGQSNETLAFSEIGSLNILPSQKSEASLPCPLQGSGEIMFQGCEGGSLCPP